MVTKKAKTKREPRDINELAFSIVESFTSEDQPIPEELIGDDPETIEMRKQSGAKGGKVRAESLSAKRRRAIAKKAAKTRWSEHK